LIHFEQATSPNLQTLSVDLKLSALEGSFDLFKSSIVVKYDTLALGANVINNGILTINEITEPYLDNYTLSASDINFDKFRINLTYLGGQGNLFTINEEKRLIGNINLSLSSFNGIGEVNFDYPEMEQENLYYDENTRRGKPFDCIEVKNEIFPVTTPVITSFSPSSAAAGVDQNSINELPVPGVITILGENFGTPQAGAFKPSNIKLGFANAGPSNVSWCFPPERDIIYWGEDSIVVRVPSVNEDNQISTYAGTGQLLMWNTADNIFSYSTQNLYIPFCVTNRTNLYQPSNTRESILTKLENTNGSGGYDLYFGDLFVEEINGGKEAFTRALDTWRCSTHINIIIKPKEEIINLAEACMINLDPTLPAGVTSTLAVTNRNPLNCNDNSHATQLKFDIRFSKYIWRQSDSITGLPPTKLVWWTEEAPMGESMDTFPNRDLETVALHELGHGSMLLHTNNEVNIMHSPHQRTLRSLFADDLDGGIHTVKLSGTDPHCEAQMIEYECSPNSTDNLFSLNAQVYPNPTYSFIQIVFPDYFSGQIKVRDIFGSLQIVEMTNLSLEKNLSLEGLAKGIYMVSFEGKQGELLQTIKIVKI